MKRAFSTLLMASMLGLTAVAALPMPATAQASYGDDTPLVIIRFNQRQVNYQQMLYSAVASAVQVNPDVMFDLVGYAPGGPDSDSVERNANAAGARSNEVARSLQSMGVPMSRISQRIQNGSESGYPEVRVFVK